MRQPLPNALIIGVQKSATTWLQKRLAQHPDIFMVDEEVHFFDNDRNYARGVDWYREKFTGSESYAIRCEKTGAYFWTTCQDVPHEPKDKLERMHALLPDAKHILVLRDPVRRALSAWNHNVRSGSIPLKYSIERILEPDHDALVARHGILTRGLYHAQLTNLLKVFPRENVLVLFQETDVIGNPKGGLRKTCVFLGVDPNVPFGEVNQPENRHEATRLGTALAGRMQGIPRRMVHALDRRILTHLPLARLTYPKPSKALLAKLAEYFQEDSARLEADFGPLPPQWSVPARTGR